jgi:hypothetical protein
MKNKSNTEIVNELHNLRKQFFLSYSNGNSITNEKILKEINLLTDELKKRNELVNRRFFNKLIFYISNIL